MGKIVPMSQHNFTAAAVERFKRLNIPQNPVFADKNLWIHKNEKVTTKNNTSPLFAVVASIEVRKEERVFILPCNKVY